VKRYRFRFEHVERVRRIQEERARAELLASRQRLIQAGADLSRASDHYDARRSGSGLSAASEFRSARDRDELLSASVVAARAAEANALLVVNQRLDAWTQAASALSAMERLDERMRDRHAADAVREEQVELDDLVAPRLAVKKREET
jgi:flagellar export protein FliJ